MPNSKASKGLAGLLSTYKSIANLLMFWYPSQTGALVICHITYFKSLNVCKDSMPSCKIEHSGACV